MNKLRDKALLLYLERIGLPNPALDNTSDIARDFLKLGIHDLYHAIEYIHQLPYRRVSDGNNYRLTLSEHCGTCSPKHALLADLAASLNVPLDLKVGAVFLNARNAPQIASVLQQYQLSKMLETHSYLEYLGQRLDITFPHMSNFTMPYLLIQEIIISPQKIGDNVQWHKEMMREWRINEKLNYDEETLWKIRELCIDALSLKP
jgi:hypothetical protein